MHGPDDVGLVHCVAAILTSKVGLERGRASRGGEVRRYAVLDGSDIVAAMFGVLEPVRKTSLQQLSV